MKSRLDGIVNVERDVNRDDTWLNGQGEHR